MSKTCPEGAGGTRDESKVKLTSNSYNEEFDPGSG